VKDNLILQAPKGEEGRAVEQAVEVFPILGDRLQQQAGTMSGGEQQMLSMAAAYTRNPSVVLVDEASLGLAPLVVDTIFAFLESLPQRGTAVLMVDQFVGRALAVASTVYVIRRGSIVLESKADKIADSNVLEEYFGNG
jgi:branched-chain amino acid transport system ATP-binding protein